MADSWESIEIPVGLSPGDVPVGTEWPKKVWLILPQTPTDAQSSAIRRVRASLGEYGFVSVSDLRVKIVKGDGGFKFPLLAANDVASLYRGAHRTRSVVIAFGEVKILLDASEIPTNKGCMALEDFIQHKCAYLLVTRAEEVSRALKRATAWVDEVNCEGPNDPRCLPKSIFPMDDGNSMATHQERQEFVSKHKAARKDRFLTDPLGRKWQAGPNHTFDLIQVAGQALPIGFHWDVQAAAKTTTIATGWETWKLPGGGYTNIHPDAYIRGGKATKVYPSAISERSSGGLRKSRNSQRSKGWK